jgi:hypothetical protein
LCIHRDLRPVSAAMGPGRNKARCPTSTNVPWLPTGPEPVDSDIRLVWSDVARYEQSNKVNELNRKSAKWTAATAVAGFVGLVAGSWPT